MLLTTAVGAALSFFAVVHLTSHEKGTGAADTPRLPVRRLHEKSHPGKTASHDCVSVYTCCCSIISIFFVVVVAAFV